MFCYVRIVQRFEQQGAYPAAQKAEQYEHNKTYRNFRNSIKMLLFQFINGPIVIPFLSISAN